MLIALALLAASAAPTTIDTVRPVLRVQVEVEAGVRLDPADLDAVGTELQRIWSPALVVHVAEGADAMASTDTAPVRVVFTDRMHGAGDGAGLGWIDFVDGEPQSEMFVSVRATRTMVDAGEWEGRPIGTLPRRFRTQVVRQALARAAAHELGHYLLHTSHHSPRGLMKASFSVDDVMDPRLVVLLDAAQVMEVRRRAGAFGPKVQADAGPAQRSTGEPARPLPNS